MLTFQHCFDFLNSVIILLCSRKGIRDEQGRGKEGGKEGWMERTYWVLES